MSRAAVGRRDGLGSRPTAINSRFWDGNADRWPHQDPKVLPCWGLWPVPERDIGALGDFAGKRVLDAGCSFGEACVALAEQGAAGCVGYDLSTKRIKQACKSAKRAGVEKLCRFEVRDASHDLPLDDGSVDIVLSHRGALSYSDPREAVPELARVLASGGVLAACVASPLAVAGYWMKNERGEGQDYYSVSVFDDGQTVEYACGFGVWVRLFRDNGFVIEDAIELPNPLLPHPCEIVWKARKT